MLDTVKDVDALAVMLKKKNLFAAVAAASLAVPLHPLEVIPEVTGAGAVRPDPRAICENVNPVAVGTVAKAWVLVLQPL
jgi:hypothetical protein